MKSCENFVSEQSNYFVHLPSSAAEKTFFYPNCTGDFIYEAGYSLKREAYDSFLLMYIRSGHLTLEYEGRTEVVNAGSFVLLDCYRPHVYYSDTGWESLWFHFDGPAARAHYELITSQLGQLFTLARPWPVLDKMTSPVPYFSSRRTGQRGASLQTDHRHTDIPSAFCPVSSGRSQPHGHRRGYSIVYSGTLCRGSYDSETGFPRRTESVSFYPDFQTGNRIYTPRIYTQFPHKHGKIPAEDIPSLRERYML